MRRKIYRLSEDQFDTHKTKIISSVAEINLTCNAGSDFSDSFIISGEDDKNIRGVIYSTNPYIIPLDYQFDGVSNTIQYKLKHNNFKINDVLEGLFIVVADGESITIPVKITFVRQAIKSSIGEINSLNDFGRLCQENMSEANHIFHTEAFSNLIDEEDINIRLIYRGYLRSVPSLNNLEEFLVAIGLKERISISIDRTHEAYNDITENQKEEILITKSTWGNVEIDIEVDADFVTIELSHIDTDYFLGSIMHFDYYIHKNRMHKGINLAKISFDTNNQHLEYKITARLSGEEDVIDFSYHDTKRRKIEFVSNYEAYRLSKITTGEWASKSIELLDTFITDIRYANEEGRDIVYDICGSDIEFYELMKAHAYIANGQRQEALWIIQKIKLKIGDKKSVKWAYLLYLCTLIEREVSYVNRLTQEIEVIFRSHPDDVRVFWYLLFLREEYALNTMRKLKDITMWLDSGFDSPYLYVEAYAIYRQEPHLIKDLSNKVIKILLWAARRDALTDDMCSRIIMLLDKCTSYDERIFKIASNAYERVGDDESLEVIVKYLMRTNSYSEKYLRWYELCLYKELKITGVYEAYLMCLSKEQLVSLPQVLLMYFRYQNNLSYEKKAIVYSNVILYKNDYPSLYQQYQRTIELFAIEQMDLGRIDDALAIIYQDVLDNGMVNEDIAKNIAPLLNAARISVMRDDCARVLVLSEEIANPYVAAVKDNVCYVPILTKDYAVLLEDNNNVLHALRSDYTCEPLLRSDTLSDNLKKLSPHSLPYVISYFDELKDTALPHILSGDKVDALKVEDLHSVDTFITSDAVAKDYRCRFYPLIIEFLLSLGREDMIIKHLTEDVSYDRIDCQSLPYVIKLFIEKESYDRAYYIISTYNASLLDKNLSYRLCEHMITEDYEEIKDSFFISILADTIDEVDMSQDSYAFLCEEYVGPTDKMIMLWQKAYNKGVDTHKLEDRILVQMFYSEQISDNCHDIFKSYVTGDYNKMLKEAILTYYSHQYIMRRISNIDEFDAALIFKAYNRGDRQNDSCKIALMKHLCLKKDLDSKEIDLLDGLIREYVVKNTYFSFYKNMTHQLIVKYQLYDKKYVEYYGESNQRISIVYKNNDSEIITEEMSEMYSGLYVKQFVLFFGDNVYFEVRRDEEILVKDVLVYNEYVSDSDSRYDMINKMQSSLMYYDEKLLLDKMKTYHGLDYVTRQLFARV